ncbi:unnamed protein product [Meloidogyne enterolobii]|uniref:Uncharacterized protein n=1 Tax=Meloidogyne enterolobii TaxID=390850 RepID=A0ACB1A1M7_MELEN
MAIARYFLKLLFNCAFELFGSFHFIINPQMIELLFDETTTDFPLQMHSQCARILVFEDNAIKFISNHLISNQLDVEIDRPIDLSKNFNPLFKILANGGNRFSVISYARNISYIL